MALSTLLISAREHPPVWFETGEAMIALDTLVHNILHRTGILQGCGIAHSTGQPATGSTAAAKSSEPSLVYFLLAASIQDSRERFRASCNTPLGAFAGLRA
jgi:hypothetical protein